MKKQLITLGALATMLLAASPTVKAAQDLPFADSFAGAVINPDIWTVETGTYKWTAKEKAGPTSSNDVSAQDGDGGFIWFNAYNTSTSNLIISPEFNSSSATAATVAFYMYHSTNGGSFKDRVSIQLKKDDGDWTMVGTEIKRYADSNGWVRYERDLGDLSDCTTFQIAVKGQGDGGYNLLVDNISVYNKLNHNLSAVSVTGPTKGAVGAVTEFAVTVSNLGANDVLAADYTITAMADGVTVGTAKGVDIASGTSASIPFNCVFDTEGKKELSVSVDYADDEDSSDNTSEFTVNVIGSINLPFADSFANTTGSFGDYWEVSAESTSSTNEYKWESAAKSVGGTAVTPYDNDGGLAYYNTYSAPFYNKSRLYTTPIKYNAGDTPAVSFWFYHRSSGNDEFYVQVKKDDGEWEKVNTLPITVKGAAEGWTKYDMMLGEALADCQNTYQVGFYGESNRGQTMVIDNILIYNKLAHNLIAGAISGPAKMIAGDKGEFSFVVVNQGANDVAAADYTVKVMRGGVEVATIEGADVKAGESVTLKFEDAVDATGTAVYTAEIVYAADEETDNNVSEPYSVEIINTVMPVAAADIKALTMADGSRAISWTAPAVSVDGVAFDPARLVYDVYRAAGESETLIEANVAGTSCTDTYAAAQLEKVTYKVVAKFGENAAEAGVSGPVVIGSTDLPYADSFANAAIGEFWTIESTKADFPWTARATGSGPECAPVDGDGGLVWFNSASYNANNNSSSLITPNLNVSSATSPYVSFWFYKIGSTRNDYLEVLLSKDGADAEVVKTISLGKESDDDEAEGWTLIEVPLAEALADCQSIFSVALKGYAKMGENMHVDQFSVYNKSGDDLVVSDIKAAISASTKDVVVGTDVKFTVSLRNNGVNAANGADYTVALFNGATQVAVAEGVDAAPAETVEVEVVAPADKATEGLNTYHAVVNFAADGDLANNTSKDLAINYKTDFSIPSFTATFSSKGSTRTVKWEVPALGAYWTYFDVAQLRYSISRISAEGTTLVAENVDGTSYEDEYEATGLETLQYEVVAQLNGVSQKATTEAMIVGTAALPFTDNFVAVDEETEATVAQASEYWTITTSVKDKKWTATKSGSNPSVTAEDGGMMTYNSYSATKDNWSTMATPPIGIASATNPTVKFSFYHDTGSSSSNDLIQLLIQVDGGEWVQIDELKRYNGTSGWEAYEKNISAYVQDCEDAFVVAIKAVSGYGNNMFIDDFSIFNKAAFDLEAASIAGPASVAAGLEAVYTFNVKNNGGSTVAADDYTVEVTRDGEAYATLPGIEVAAGETAAVTLTVVMTPADVAGHIFGGSVVYGADLVAENNTFANEVATAVTISANAPVTDLAAEANADGTVALTWSPVVDMQGFEPVNLFEDFASFEVGAVGPFGEWTTYDGDGEAGGSRFGQSSSEFKIFDESANSYAPKAPDGDHRAIFVTCAGDVNQDDWLISPEINCAPFAEMKLSFQGNFGNGEKSVFEILYSTTDNQPASFTNLVEEKTISSYAADGKYYEYSFSGIPAEAKYIAIHLKSKFDYTNNALIDDVKIVDNVVAPIGYNVYEDGVKINDEMLSANAVSFVAPAAEADGERSFTVTAVYPDGESAMSNVAVAEVAAAPITIYWDNTSAQWTTPAVKVEDNEPIVMTCLYDGPRPEVTLFANDTNILAYNAYMAEVPANKAITFVDAAEPENEAKATAIDAPEHNKVYNEDGASRDYSDDIITGVENVNVDLDSTEAVYYNLQGVRMENPEKGRVYIMVRGGKTSKVKL